MEGLGLARAQRQDYVGALEFYEVLLDEARGRNESSEAVARLHGMIADVAQAQLDIEKSIEHSRESLRIFRLIYGTNHPKVAAALGDLGDLLMEPDQLEEGERLLREAIRISEAVRGPGFFGHHGARGSARKNADQDRRP